MMKRTQAQIQVSFDRRNEAIYRAYLNGKRGRALMRKYGIKTRQRLHQIIQREAKRAESKN